MQTSQSTRAPFRLADSTSVARSTYPIGGQGSVYAVQGETRAYATLTEILEVGESSQHVPPDMYANLVPILLPCSDECVIQISALRFDWPELIRSTRHCSTRRELSGSRADVGSKGIGIQYQVPG